MFAAGRKMGQMHAEQAAAQAEANREEGAKAAIQQQQQQAQTSAAPAETNMTAELQKLADLHSSGILSDEEFTAAKKKLLGI